VVEKMRKRLFSLLIVVSLIFSLNISAFAASTTPTFGDLTNYPWAVSAINQLAAAGILNGTGNGNFSPGSSITRADYVVIMCRLLNWNVSFSTNFVDVTPGTYFYAAVGMARQLGVVNGTDSNHFSPTSPITRQDMFVMTDRILQMQKSIASATSTTLPYADSSSISSYAVQAIADLSAFLQGDASNNINPTQPATRAETAVFISRVQSGLLTPTAAPSPKPTAIPTPAGTPSPTPMPKSSIPKIAVYAGHGGSDPGAIGVNGLQEKNYTLEVSNLVSTYLHNSGYLVVNNRTTDVDRNIATDAALANWQNVDALVEIHLNANDGAPLSGTESYYSVFDTGIGSSLANTIVNNISALGFINLGAKTRANSDGNDYLGIIRLTHAPAVLIETAFINNPDDMARYNVTTMAQAIANAIIKNFPTKK